MDVCVSVYVWRGAGRVWALLPGTIIYREIYSNVSKTHNIVSTSKRCCYDAV